MEQQTSEGNGTKVVRTISGEVEQLGGEFERLVVQQATSTQYAYRVYRAGDAEYEGGVIDLLDEGV